ncbi:MAG: SDR family oxidoreductase [Wenzhouxiangellaceae bacterium]|nr:SDR family oxidoreductase [Wenzhouxiangellaceae bacterium]
MSRLAGRRVILTGAGGGIGSALATILIEQGARLMLLGRNPEALAQQARTLGAGTGHAVLDLRHADQLDALPGRVAQQLGAADTLVHCAGAGHFGPFEACRPDDIERLIEVNLTGPIRLTHALLPMLLKQPSPQLVLVGSALGRIGYPGQATYCASKAGLHRFGEAIRREYRDQGLRVVHVAPRATATAFNSTAQQATNRRLKVAEDPTDRVAHAIVEAMTRNRIETVLGFPEWLATRLNQWMPGLFDRVFATHAEVMRDESARAAQLPGNAIEGVRK